MYFIKYKAFQYFIEYFIKFTLILIVYIMVQSAFKIAIGISIERNKRSTAFHVKSKGNSRKAVDLPFLSIRILIEIWKTNWAYYKDTTFR